MVAGTGARHSVTGGCPRWIVSADSGGLATPSCLARADGTVFVYFSFEGGPPDYKPVNSLPNGPRGIGIARASRPLGPFLRLEPAAPAPPWPTNSTWSHGSHPGGILDDSQVLEHAGFFHMFHSRKLWDTPGCPPAKHGENVCCVEWRTSTNAENWTRQGVVLNRVPQGPACELHACEPMSARIFNDTLVLLTDGGACGTRSQSPRSGPDLGLVAWTAPIAVLGASPRKLFVFDPAADQLLDSYANFPVDSRNYALKVMPKSGTPRLVGVGSLLNATTATFRVYPVSTGDALRGEKQKGSGDADEKW